MNLDSVPIWAIFVGTILLVMAFIEVGHRLGDIAHRKSEDEKEAPISGVSGAVLGLTAFILALTFGIVSERYEARKALVRADADAIRATYLRADFLPEPDRTESKRLLKTYLDRRLAFVRIEKIERQDPRPWLAEAERTHRRLWDIAVANARKDMNSDVAALYIESLNEMIAVNEARVTLGIRARIPMGIWAVLYSLTILGMISIGYHAGIVGSKRSRATLIVAISFGMVIALIAILDRPWGAMKVTQQPLVDLQEFISAPM